MGSLLTRLRQPRTWATLVVLLLVGTLYLVSEFGGQDQAGDATTPTPSAVVPGDSSAAQPDATPPGTNKPGTNKPGTDKPSTNKPGTNEPGTTRPTTVPTAPLPTREPGSDVDRASGLAWIDVGDLPSEAEGVLLAIEDGGPFVREKDGSTFGNYEGVLPRRERGYYREYTVPTPGVAHAGARRIVTGEGGEWYWTADHYQTFARIDR